MFHSLPILYKTDARRNTRVWKIKMGYYDKLINDVSSDIISYDFNDFDNDAHHIVIVLNYGVLNGKMNKSYTSVMRGKGGRSLTEQGLSVMSSKHNKKINREDYRDTIDAAKNELIINPMLAKNYRVEYVNKGRHLNFGHNKFYYQGRQWSLQ